MYLGTYDHKNIKPYFGIWTNLKQAFFFHCFLLYLLLGNTAAVAANDSAFDILFNMPQDPRCASGYSKTMKTKIHRLIKSRKLAIAIEDLSGAKQPVLYQ